MAFLRRYILFLSCLLCLAGALAQERYIKFGFLSEQHGLPNNKVECVFQDSKGFLWIGTKDGLAFYDGYTFINYKATDDMPNPISDSRVWSVTEDTFGSIWIGTNEGLNRFDKKTRKFIVYKNKPGDANSLNSNTVRVVETDRSGNLWVGTAKGVAKAVINPNSLDLKFENYRDLPNQNGSNHNNIIRDILVDSQGVVWLGTSGQGLLRYRQEKNTFESFVHSSKNKRSLSHNYVNVVMESAAGEIWVGTDDGLNRFYPKNNDFDVFHEKTNQANSLQNGIIHGLAEDHNGVFWIGTADGLYSYHIPTNEFVAYKHDFNDRHSLSSNHINNVFVDKSGLLWVAADGLNYYDSKAEKFKAFHYDFYNTNSLSNGDVRAVKEDKSGLLWLGTAGGGVNLYNRQLHTFTHLKSNVDETNSLTDNEVFALLIDDKGKAWIGTNNGLDIYDPQTKKFAHHHHQRNAPKTLSDNTIKVIYQDKKGTVWIGTESGGLNEYLPASNAFRAYRHIPRNPTGLSNDHILSIFEDSKGQFWVGTKGGGLNLFDRVSGKSVLFQQDITNSKSLVNNNVNAIFESADGSLWIGTQNGLDKFEQKENVFKHFDESLGMPSNSILAIQEDASGSLWLSTEKGISKFLVEESEFHNFDPSDNLQGMEFNLGAVHKSASGEMFFGGIHGLNSFFPDSVKKDEFLPNVVITDFQIFNRSVPIADPETGIDSPLKGHISEATEIELSYEDNVISFEFVALSYSRSERNQYAHYLENYDQAWHYIGDRRTATYTNLPPGDYVFRVMGSNSDGIWNENGSFIKIRILPPVWKTFWFQLSFFAAAIIFVLVIYKYRVKSVEDKNRELEKLVMKRTQEIQESKGEVEAKNKQLEGVQEEILSQKNNIEKQNLMLKAANEKITTQKDNIESTYKNLRGLSLIGQQITSILYEKDVISKVYHSVNELMDATGFGIATYNAENESLEFNGYIENGNVLPSFSVPLEDSNQLSVYCFLNRKELVMNDVEHEFSKYIKNSKAVKGDMPLSLMYLPMMVDNRPTGVITVQSFQKNAYNMTSLTILKTLASYTSIALDNAKYLGQLKAANKIIQNKNQNILDSIRYAEQIQKAILPNSTKIGKYLPEYFKLFKPKDIVSGDFYWFMETDEKHYLAAVDCTGHGVPGAFMSLVANTLLNEIINQMRIFVPSLILAKLHESIRYALKQHESANDDGMDICLCAIDEKQGIVTFAGAKRPLFYVQGGELFEEKGDRKSIGGRQKEDVRSFTDNKIPIGEGIVLYFTTDGFADQHNEEGEKYGTARLRKTLLAISTLPIAEQKNELARELKEHQGNQVQRDDITVLAVKLGK